MPIHKNDNKTPQWCRTAIPFSICPPRKQGTPPRDTTSNTRRNRIIIDNYAAGPRVEPKWPTDWPAAGPPFFMFELIHAPKSSETGRAVLSQWFTCYTMRRRATHNALSDVQSLSILFIVHFTALGDRHQPRQQVVGFYFTGMIFTKH